MNAKELLRHHVNAALARGESPVVEMPSPETIKFRREILAATPLAKAFRFHLQTLRVSPSTLGTRTARIMALARNDVAIGVARYPKPVKPYAPTTRQSDGKTYVEKTESAGLRFVGKVTPEESKTTTRDGMGWHTDPYGDTCRDGTGLCWGEVYQLPGKDCKARYVAGYRDGNGDSGPVLDLREIFEDDRRGGSSYDDDSDALRDACRSADHMAERAAESEREYQAAWQAGNRFADLLAEIKDTQAENEKLRAELRELTDKHRPSPAVPSIIKATRDKIRENVESIQECRDKRKRLRDGQGESDSDFHRAFWTGDKRLMEAFEEGTGR